MSEREYPKEHSEYSREHSEAQGGAIVEERVTGRERVMGRRSYFRGLSWGAIIAGTLVAVVVMVVLNILGVAIGAAVLDVGVEQTGLGVGAGIWWTVSALIGLFCGGWVAGRLSESMDRGEGVIHGVVTWSLFVFASLFLVTTTVGQLVGGAFGMLGQQVSAAIGGVTDLAALEGLLIELGATPEAVTTAQAELILAGEQAADALAAGATWAFIALLLGVLVCALGSLIGATLPTEGEPRVERTRRALRPRTA